VPLPVCQRFLIFLFALQRMFFWLPLDIAILWPAPCFFSIGISVESSRAAETEGKDRFRGDAPGGGGRPRPCSLLRCSAARTEGAQRQVDWRVAVTDGQSAAHGRRLCVSEPGRLAKQLMSLMLH